MKRKRRPQKLILKLTAACLLLGALFFLLKSRKDELTHYSLVMLEESLKQKFGLSVRVGNVKGRFLGKVILENVSVSDPRLPEDRRNVFKAASIQFRYNWIDFFSKNMNSRIEIIIQDPVIWWRPYIAIRVPRNPFFDMIKDWTLSQKGNIYIAARNMRVVLGTDRSQTELVEINFNYRDNLLDLTIPVRHIHFMKSDICSVVHVKAALQPASLFRNTFLEGTLYTEGTVVNLKPVKRESSLNFALSGEALFFNAEDFFGGLTVSGEINYKKDLSLDLSVKAENYALSNLKEFFWRGLEPFFMGWADMELKMMGDLFAPRMESHIRLHEIALGSNIIKQLSLQLSGIYPTVEIRDSSIVLSDGLKRPFAVKTVDVKELFWEKTYQGLIESGQAWGDWEAHKAQSNFDPLKLSETKLSEVGFRYELRSENSLKFGVKKDEEFIGIEKKKQF